MSDWFDAPGIGVRNTGPRGRAVFFGGPLDGREMDIGDLWDVVEWDGNQLRPIAPWEEPDNPPAHKPEETLRVQTLYASNPTIYQKKRWRRGLQRQGLTPYVAVDSD